MKVAAQPPLRVAVTGHRFFDADAGAYICARVSETLQELAAGGREVRVISSLAEGADQLVARYAVDHGLRLEVIVPATGYAETLTSAQDQQEYAALVARAATVDTLAHPRPTAAAYREAGMVMLTRADHLMAIWDGGPARGTGGSAEVVQRARELGIDIHVIWPSGYQRPQ